MTKKSLLKRIEEIELKIFIYSDRDIVMVEELEIELKKLNMQLLDKMVA